jgi:hypothetical protein
VSEFELAVELLQRASAPEQRAAAQQSLTALRDSPHAVQTLLAVVTATQTHAAQAVAGTLLRHAVLRDWAVLEGDAVRHVRDTLLQVATDAHGDRAARRQLLAAAVLLVKRTWQQDAQSVARLWVRVRELFAMAHPAPRVALDLCAALVEQFAYRATAHASDDARTNLSCEFHRAACRAFVDERHLLDVFLVTLEQTQRAFDEFRRAQPVQLVQFLEDAFDVLRSVLEWPFAPDGDGDGGDGGDGGVRRLPAHWIEALEPQRLAAIGQFLLDVLAACERNSKLSARVRSVLERLVSLDVDAYVDTLLVLATRLLAESLDSDRHVQSYAVLGAVEAAHSFVAVYDTRRLLATADRDALCAFAAQLAATVVAALEPEPDGADSALRGETLELALVALAALVDESLAVPPAFAVLGGDDVSTVAAPPLSPSQSIASALPPAFFECAELVVIAYGSARMREAADPHSWADSLESDVELYDEQLRAFGKLARVALALSGANAATDRFWPQMREWLAALSGAGENDAFDDVSSERAHWLLLLATHMLCLIDQRSVPASLNCVSSLAAADDADQVSLLGDALLAFLGAAHARSPLLHETELWAMAKWLATYAFPVAGRGLSARLVAKFGAGGAGDAALTFVVDKVAQALRECASEPGVCAAAADVVESLARLQRARHLAAHNDAFRRFAPTASSQLAGKASRKLIAAVVRLASDTADSVAAIAAPIAAQLRAALADSSFLSQAQNAPQKLALAHVFELLRGVCSGAADGNRNDVVLLFLGDAADGGPSLLSLYEPLMQLFVAHEDIVLRLLKSLRQLTALAARFADDERVMAALGRGTVAALRRYQESNVLATVVRRIDEGTIGDRCSDIVALLDIVANFAAHVASSPAALHVVCVGLELLLPLVSDNVSIGVLSVGKVARRFYGLLFVVFEQHAAAVLPHLSEPQQRTLFGALQHGFSQNNADALAFAVETVTGLAAAIDADALADMQSTLLVGMLVNQVSLSPAVVDSASDALRSAPHAVLQAVCERTVAAVAARAPHEHAPDVTARLTLALHELFSGDVPLERTSFFTAAGAHGIDAPTALLFRVRLRHFLLYAASFANFT